MLEDPIVEEVRKVRNAHAKKFNYDLEAIGVDLIKQQEASGCKLVSLPPRKPINIQELRQQTNASALAEPKSVYRPKKTG
jgi:hypothetical protein